MKHLLLVGAGQAHLQLLLQLRRFNRQAQQQKKAVVNPLPGIRTTLINTAPNIVNPSMLPGFLAGQYTLDQIRVDLEALTHQAGVDFVQATANKLHLPDHQLILRDGKTVEFDQLSLSVGTTNDRNALEGAARNALFVRPLDQFVTLWPRVLEMSKQHILCVAVIGGGPSGVEIALNIKAVLDQQLSTNQGCGGHVTLIVGQYGLVPDWPAQAQAQVANLLRERAVSVVHDEAVAVHEGKVQLKSGGLLATHAPIVCTTTQAPSWLQGSGLALNGQGYVQVDNTLRSISHSNVWACGDCVEVSSMAQTPQRNASMATHAGKVLVQNLYRYAATQPAIAWTAPSSTLSLLGDGQGRALAVKGDAVYSFGRWAWWLKRWADRRWIRQFAS